MPKDSHKKAPKYLKLMDTFFLLIYLELHSYFLFYSLTIRF